MARLNELDKIEYECTKWLKENKSATYPQIIAVYDTRLTAMKEKTEIYKKQLEKLTNEKNY